MNTSGKGAKAENRVRAEMEADGYLVKGSGDAHGVVDLIGVKHPDEYSARVLLVQVKGARIDRGPFADFPPKERQAFRDECRRVGCRGVLAYSPSETVPTRWIWPSEWP